MFHFILQLPKFICPQFHLQITMSEQFILNVQHQNTLDPYSDKVILPQHVLSSILENFPGKLPHPLIFQIEGELGQSCCVGVKEFSSEEEECILPKFVQDKLNQPDKVQISMIEIPKATSLKVRPAHFYTSITNWKFFLENKLNKYYTCISNGVIVILDGTLRYELHIEEINGKENTTACIVDTDIVLDVVPLNDSSANQQLAEMIRNPHNNITNLEDTALIQDYLPFTDPKFIPKIFKIDLTKFSNQIEILVTSEYLINIDLLVGLDKFLNMENFRNSTMDEDQESSKSVVISLNNDDIQARARGEDDEDNSKWIYVVPVLWEHTSDFRIQVGEHTEDTIVLDDPEATLDPSSKTCSNCTKSIPLEKFQLHELFCLKNNKKCPQCDEVFLKAIPETHWHCECGFYTNSSLAKFKHIKLNHSGPYTCEQCHSQETYSTFDELVTHHKSTTCPERIHECQFCRLVVPIGLATYQDNFENLTNHENLCGNKTNDCYKCGKPCRVKDFKKHLQLHDLDKLNFNQVNKIMFNKCRNENCIQLISNLNNDLGLCDLCYGPLYIQQYDPTNLKLQMRIERKYMMQLTKGCGQLWCTNEYCVTGSHHKGTMKELIILLRETLFRKILNPLLPVNKNIQTERNQFWFCVNESVSQKKLLVALLDGEYELEMIYKAVNEQSGESNVRRWLEGNAVRV